MFNFLKKKDDTLYLYKPVEGKVIDITEVQDSMFSDKLMGDGVAIEPSGAEILSPCDGKVLLVPKTLHAVAIEAANGVEVLVHIGMDTVELKGQGFTSHVSAGDAIKRGDRLISFDREYIEKMGKSLTTPIVITNGDEKVTQVRKVLAGGDGLIMELKLKS